MKYSIDDFHDWVRIRNSYKKQYKYDLSASIYIDYSYCRGRFHVYFIRLEEVKDLFKIVENKIPENLDQQDLMKIIDEFLMKLAKMAAFI